MKVSCSTKRIVRFDICKSHVHICFMLLFFSCLIFDDKKDEMMLTSVANVRGTHLQYIDYYSKTE